jgi:drug/metabolite transporter (DMT)-like permease
VPAQRDIRAAVALAVAVTAISWAAILVRLALAPALVIAFYRMLFSTVALTPAVFVKDRRPDLKTTVLVITAGILLGLHFATWISSLSYTSVASSVMLVTTQPVFTAILGPLFLGEKTGRRGFLAVALAAAGVALIAGSDMSAGGDALFGDLLATAGALTAAIYLMIGRLLREKIRFTRYLLWVNGTAALVLFGFVSFLDLPLSGFPATTWLWFGLLALGPNLIGHGLLNWSVRRLPAFPVNMAILGEPVLATLYAALIFSEMPPALFYFGSCLILTGILVVTWKIPFVSGDSREIA